MRAIAGTLALLGMAASSAAAPEGPFGPPPDPKEVTIPTDDEGIRLVATLYEPPGGGEGKPALLALHHEGKSGSGAVWEKVARKLASEGVSVLAPDLRGHGRSAVQNGVDLAPRAEAKDEALWKAMDADVKACLKYLRGTLLVDGKNLGVAGTGAGAGLALVACEKDEKVRLFLGAAPAPSACGLAGMASAVRWNDRPAGLVIAPPDEKGDAAALAKELRKHRRTDVLAVPMDRKSAPEDLGADERFGLEAAQFVIGWLQRPAFTGAKEEGVRRGGGIFAGGSAFQEGICAGGMKFEGYFAPGKITAVVVLADPDPKAAKLTTSSRRITVTPAPGKEPALSVVVETWAGSGWKKEKPFTVVDSGCFEVDGKTTFYQVWLPPSVLGVRPFSTIAVHSSVIVDGESKSAGGTGGTPKKPTVPSSWSKWELR